MCVAGRISLRYAAHEQNWASYHSYKTCKRILASPGGRSHEGLGILSRRIKPVCWILSAEQSERNTAPLRLWLYIRLISRNHLYKYCTLPLKNTAFCLLSGYRTKTSLHEKSDGLMAPTSGTEIRDYASSLASPWTRVQSIHASYLANQAQSRLQKERASLLPETHDF
jgi:hypothetical protein